VHVVLEVVAIMGACVALQHAREAMYVERNTEALSRIIVAVEKNKYYLLVCMCVRACVRVGTRAHGHVHAHAHKCM
jgi:hypothetical protein